MSVVVTVARAVVVTVARTVAGAVVGAAVGTVGAVVLETVGVVEYIGPGLLTSCAGTMGVALCAAGGMIVTW